MQLTLWSYEGPPHIGTMRVAAAMTGLHAVLHSPQGDTYADLLFTMIERQSGRPPVSWSSFQARDLGGDTAGVFQRTMRDAYERFRPQAMLVGATCTAELIQDDPGGLARAAGLPVPVIPLELPSYQRKENWGAAETFYQLVRQLVGKPEGLPQRAPLKDADGRLLRRPVVNLLGPTALGFRHRDDLAEVMRLLALAGVDVGVTAPMGASPADLQRLPEADLNLVLYPEIASVDARWLERTWRQPCIAIAPIGLGATADWLRAIAAATGADVSAALAELDGRARWYARSVDAHYLTAKRVFIFGDATHAIAAARVAREEMGFDVVGLGSYSREFAREVREAASAIGLEALITDDYLEVEAQIAALQPELVLGTQMERHVAKRLGLPCAVISAPVHVQDFPARRAPQMGVEGANVMFDTWVHPLMMGLEEHLLQMFRDDFEFHADASPSHLGHAGAGEPVTPATPARPQPALTTAHGQAAQANAIAQQALDQILAASMSAAASAAAVATPAAPATAPAAAAAVPKAAAAAPADPTWTAEAERELHKIPFFVRGKARRNTERFARERGLATITVETLYDAKAHFSA